MPERTIEDRLREEYFELLPDVRRVAEELETEVRHCLLPVSRNLNRYEQIVITARIKECESAVDALRRRQEYSIFDRAQQTLYTLRNLRDLAHKYYGRCKASEKVWGEFQVVPMLTALFWEVEHTAIYKPSPDLKGIAGSPEMRERTTEVLSALENFEREFESLIHRSSNTKD